VEGEFCELRGCRRFYEVRRFREPRAAPRAHRRPHGVPHRYTVDSGPARLLYVLSPAGFEEFVYATSEPTSEPAKERTLPPAPEGPPSEAEMEQLRTLARQ